jgi:hypothetical protein
VSNKPSPLAEFFREEAPAWGNHGDHEGWSTEETAIHFLREHQQLGLAQTADWNAINSYIRSELRLALARHPKVGQALTLGEGDELISKLATSFTYGVHKRLDPSYDT